MPGFSMMEIIAAKSAPSRGLAGGLSAGCASLIEHDAVGKLQQKMLDDKTAAANDPTVQDLAGGLGSDGVDRKYGDNTHNFALNWIDWTVRQGFCSETSRTEWSRNGPNAARSCLMNYGFTSAEVDELQQAWNEYRTREACLARQAASQPPAETAPAATPTQTKSKTWIWILAGLGLLGIGIWVVASD